MPFVLRNVVFRPNPVAIITEKEPPIETVATVVIPTFEDYKPAKLSTTSRTLSKSRIDRTLTINNEVSLPGASTEDE